jgi:hypothetical protein
MDYNGTGVESADVGQESKGGPQYAPLVRLGSTQGDCATMGNLA